MTAKLTSLLSSVTDGQSLVSKLAARIFEEVSDAEDTGDNPANPKMIAGQGGLVDDVEMGTVWWNCNSINPKGTWVKFPYK